MKKTFLSLILISIFSVTIFFLLSNFLEQYDLTDAESLQFHVSVVAIAIASISASFPIFSYWNKSEAFILSQKPQLLVQVLNTKGDYNLTIFRYENFTTNAFEDLTLIINVTTLSKEISLSDLFSKEMYMSGRDSRERKFYSIKELKDRNFDLTKEMLAGNEIRLNVKYSFTFLGEKQLILSQQYKWVDKQGWNLL